jgi:ATP-dependent Zn protease
LEDNMSSTDERGGKHEGWSELERTAYHEAGHAVVGYFLDVPFGETSIIPNEEENTLGYMKPENVEAFLANLNTNGHLVKDMLATENHVLRLLAGHASELLFIGTPSMGSIDDYVRASRFLSELLQEDDIEEGKIGDGAFRWLKWKATVIVAAARDEIEAVAKALLEKKTLKRDDIVACIEEAMAKTDEGGKS